MSVENILRKKGADVATIAPDVSVRRAADWLHAKNIGSLVWLTRIAARDQLSVLWRVASQSLGDQLALGVRRR